MLSELPPLPCDGLVIIDDSTIELPRKLKHSEVPDIDHDSLFECPDIVLSEDDASSSSDSSSGKGLKRVSFSNVEVREYSVTIGDHPFCRDGLPITLDWKFNEKSTVFPVPRESRKRNADGFPRRLDYQERLSRLQCVTGITDKHMLLIQNHRVWSRKEKGL